MQAVSAGAVPGNTPFIKPIRPSWAGLSQPLANLPSTVVEGTC
jgi:hypothetical protein